MFQIYAETVTHGPYNNAYNNRAGHLVGTQCVFYGLCTCLPFFFFFTNVANVPLCIYTKSKSWKNGKDIIVVSKMDSDTILKGRNN